MTDFNELIDATPTEEQAWHEYKDAVDAIDTHRLWAMKAIDRIEDIPAFSLAHRAIEAQFAAEKEVYAIRYNNRRRALGLAPLSL